MPRQLFKVAALSVSIFCSGCSQIGKLTAFTDYQSGSMVTDQQTAIFDSMDSTSRDISSAIGAPDKVTQIGSRTFWAYSYTRTPAVPFTGRKRHKQLVVFEFDQSDALVKTQKKVFKAD